MNSVFDCRLSGVETKQFFFKCKDGVHGIGVQNVTSNYNVATLNSFFFSLYLAGRLASGETYIRW